ncbi:MAG: Gfo/Idh/MocA family oxidoreductase [Planctomycetes bacterium]|nr:Gfo/Idh/MocA family oxidoreductase [Planctomycetota bacterium]
MTAPLSRRDFLKSTGAAAGLLILSGRANATSANSRLRLASVGVGGMGASDLSSLSSHPQVEVVGLCDIDAQRLAEAAAKHPGAETFADWRQMLDKLADRIDAVNVATPDHTHAPAAMSAMQLGKHVYCQKPLTHDVYEARQLARVAAEKKLTTQMGIQVHSTSPYRTAVKVIRDGAIGRVKEAHSWSDKNWGYEGPAPTPAEPPEHVSWDLWLGTAPHRPYSPGHYHPGQWRRWLDFGCGTMGDMGIHILDPVASALELGAPKTVQSSSSPPPDDAHGIKNHVRYTFGAATPQTTEGFVLTWYDGGLRPAEASEWPLPEGQELPSQGSMFVGEKGYLLLPHVAAPQLLPAAQFEDYKLPSVEGDNHYHQWASAALAGEKSSADFGYSGPLTEMLLLGVVSNRFPGQRLDWDAAALRITNFSDANALLRREYREGWEVKGLS